VAVIGPIRLVMKHKGRQVEWSFSSKEETFDGVEIPTWIEQRQLGGSGPDIFIRVELRDGSPRVVELSFTSDRHQNEVQQKHLRQVDVDRLATDLLAFWIAGQFTEAEASRDEYERAERVAIKFLERQRLPREYRVIDDDFLRSVGEVYRQNISHAPTKAVAKAFGVKNRMASTYVDRARKAGHLPPTKQGQKKAWGDE
jgi:hypothetical protein